MKTIALVNQKGGVGKTATTANLGIGLARHGIRVAVLDFDPQGSLTDSLGWKRPDELTPTIASLMEKIIDETPIADGEGILHHSEGVDLIPANIELAGMDVALVNTMSRETILRSYLQTIRDMYDVILIDCAPTLGMLAINALTAADSVIIPSQSQYLSAKGLEQLLKTVNRVKKQINPSLQIGGILLTMVDDRANFSREMASLLRDTYGKSLNVFNTEIPRSTRAVEATAAGKSIFAFDPRGKVAAAYESLTNEVLALERLRNKVKSVER